MPAGPGLHQGRRRLSIGRRRQDVAADEPAGPGDDDYLNDRQSGTYGWVFGQIRIDPTNPEHDLHPGRAAQPIDGRRQDVRGVRAGVHSDHHGLWIDPANTNIIYNSNDGGFYQTADGGKTWKFAVAAGGVAVLQRGARHELADVGLRIDSGHGSRRGRVDISKGRGAIPAVAWEGAPGGEGSNHAVDPDQPEHRVFARVLRQLQPHGSRRRAGAARPADAAAAARRFSPTDPDRRAARAVDGAVHHLAARQQHRLRGLSSSLFKSTNRGDEWEKISHDLTDNNTAQMGENPSAIPYQTIVAMAESPKKKDLLYVGTRRRPAAHDDRRRQGVDGADDRSCRCADGFRASRRRRTPKARSTSRSAAAKTMTSRAYVYKSTDFGKTFQQHRRTTFRPGPVNVIREDPRNPNVLYVGTDFGVLRLDQRRRAMGGARRQPAVGAGVGSAVPARATTSSSSRRTAAACGRSTRAIKSKGRSRLGDNCTQTIATAAKEFSTADSRPVPARSGTRTPSSTRRTSARFSTATDDGIGDFEGLTRKLDYIQSLGVSCIWILPFYPSPLRDDGYDIADYEGVHPAYGTLKDFRAFLDAAHARGLRVITELVINHTSDQHPWFQAARRAPAGIDEARLLRLERHGHEVSGRPDHLQRHGAIELDVGSGRRRVLLAPVLSPSAGPELRQPAGAQGRAAGDALLARPWAWTACGSTPCRTSSSATAPSARTCRRRTTCSASCAREMDAHYRNRMLLAEANLWPSDVMRVLRRRRRMPHGVPLSADAAAVHGAAAGRPASDQRDPLADAARSPTTCQWAIFLRNHDELTLEMVTDEERDYMYQAYAADPQMRVNGGIRRRLAPLMENSRARIELLNGLLLSLPGHAGHLLRRRDRHGRQRVPRRPQRRAHADAVDAPIATAASRGPIRRGSTRRSIMDPVYGYQAVNVEAQERSPHLAAQLDAPA